MRKIFSLDAETNGLWGKAFAIGALVYDKNSTEIARFVGRLPDSEVTDDWVRENVLPKIVGFMGIPITHKTYDALLADFASFYLANKQEADVVVHMGYIVEARILRDLHDRGFIGDWDGPYPLLDVAGNLQQAGEDPTSIDKYVQKHGLSVGEFVGGAHNPLYDSAAAAAVYRDLLLRRDLGDERARCAVCTGKEKGDSANWKGPLCKEHSGEKGARISHLMHSTY